MKNLHNVRVAVDADDLVEAIVDMSYVEIIELIFKVETAISDSVFMDMLNAKVQEMRKDYYADETEFENATFKKHEEQFEALLKDLKKAFSNLLFKA